MGFWPKFSSFLWLASALLVQWGYKIESQSGVERRDRDERSWEGLHRDTWCLGNENLVLNLLDWAAFLKIVGFGEGKPHYVILLGLWHSYRVREITDIFVTDKSCFSVFGFVPKVVILKCVRMNISRYEIIAFQTWMSNKRSHLSCPKENTIKKRKELLNLSFEYVILFCKFQWLPYMIFRCFSPKKKCF